MSTLELPQRVARRSPFGAEPLHCGSGVDFRIWAPKCRSVDVVFENDSVPALTLEAEGNGFFTGVSDAARAGVRYKYRLDAGETYPDYASRFQPEGPHRWSEVVDPSRFVWTDDAFPGIDPADVVLYELHVGTFARQGTWRSAIDRLPTLRDLGITCIELMPVAEFNGARNWGYDGVQLFAPTRNYGTPDDLRAFVDRSHALGIAVILDVVYNHLGPHGNYVGAFTDHFLSDKHDTDWGKAINFDGDHCEPVRQFFLDNARYWIEDFHLDGFRFDATQNIYDESPEHILSAINRAARRAAPHKRLYLINENEPQHTRLVRPIERGGCGLDALWNDDFHHTAVVALTGRAEAYCSDYRGTPQEFISAAKYGYLFQGQRYAWQDKRRGTTAFDLPPHAFVNYLDNHDQIANNGRGLRMHVTTSAAQARAMTALLLLMPGTPMLFQGQEFAARQPFNYFVDHDKDLAPLIRAGREKEISQFPSTADPELLQQIPDPSDESTFQRCKLDWSQLDDTFHACTFHLHRDLIALRMSDATLARARRTSRSIDGAVIGQHAFVIRYFGDSGDDRLLVVNLGGDLHLSPAPEPLLAPPDGARWTPLLSTAAPRYGGNGVCPLETQGPSSRVPGDSWRIAAHSATFLKPIAEPQIDRQPKEGEP